MPPCKDRSRLSNEVADRNGVFPAAMRGHHLRIDVSGFLEKISKIVSVDQRMALLATSVWNAAICDCHCRPKASISTCWLMALSLVRLRHSPPPV